MAILNVPVDAGAYENAKNGGGGGQRPNGDYHLRLDATSVEKIGEKGTPQMQIKATIMRAPAGSGLEGRDATVRGIWLTPKSIPYRLIPLLDACGVNYTWLAGGTIQFDTDHLNGQVVKGTLSHDDKGFEDWGGWEPANNATQQQGAPPPMQQQQASPWQPNVPQQAPQQFGPPQGAPPQQFGPPSQQQLQGFFPVGPQQPQQPQQFGPPQGGPPMQGAPTPGWQPPNNGMPPRGYGQG